MGGFSDKVLFRTITTFLLWRLKKTKTDFQENRDWERVVFGSVVILSKRTIRKDVIFSTT